MAYKINFMHRMLHPKLARVLSSEEGDGGVGDFVFFIILDAFLHLVKGCFHIAVDRAEWLQPRI